MRWTTSRCVMDRGQDDGSDTTNEFGRLQPKGRFDWDPIPRNWGFTQSIESLQLSKWVLRTPSSEAHIALRSWRCRDRNFGHCWALGPPQPCIMCATVQHKRKIRLASGKVVELGCLEVRKILCNEPRSIGETISQK